MNENVNINDTRLRARLVLDVSPSELREIEKNRDELGFSSTEELVLTALGINSRIHGRPSSKSYAESELDSLFVGEKHDNPSPYEIEKTKNEGEDAFETEEELDYSNYKFAEPSELIKKDSKVD